MAVEIVVVLAALLLALEIGGVSLALRRYFTAQRLRADTEFADMRASISTRHESIESKVAFLEHSLESLDANQQTALNGALQQLTDLGQSVREIQQFVAGAAAQQSTQIDRLLAHQTVTAEHVESVAAEVRGLDEVVKSMREESAQFVSTSVGGVLERAGEHQADTTLLIRLLRARLPPNGDALATINSRNEDVVLTAASQLTILRPLLPYPGWVWDADWTNPDLAYQLREQIWQFFHDRRVEAAITVAWYHGTRLRLFLGNDLSRQIYVGGCIDPNEFAFLDRFLEPGMTFVDAGANDGIYSLFAAKRVGHAGTTWAFEPSGREVARLSDNLALNTSNVRVFPVALAESSGTAELAVADYAHEGQNTLGGFAYDVVTKARTEQVELTTLDSVLASTPLERLDVMKLDVEGAELRALKGATHTLSKYRPILLFEVSEPSLVHQGSNRVELLDAIRNAGYRLYAFDRSTGFPVPAVEGRYSDNMLAIPTTAQLPERVFELLPPPPPGSKS